MSRTALLLSLSAFLICALLLPAFFPLAAFAQASTRVDNPTVNYLFGESVTFQTVLYTDLPVQEALIFFQTEATSETVVRPLTVTPAGEGAYELLYQHDLIASPLRAFSDVYFHYTVTLSSGTIFTSPDFTFSYEDNRYEWTTLEEEPFVAHWAEGDLAFGQNVLDVARIGLERIQSFLPLNVPEQVDIYIYPSPSEMQSTLATSSEEWVAGHADPELGVMVVALPAGPEQRLLTEQRIPHELMHILLYSNLQSRYRNLPSWLSEGLASGSELYPNPDYQVLLNNAYQRDSLLPLASLCRGFPRDTSGALLAYAQSASFTRYLQQRFGSTGIQSLVNQYADGLECNRGVESALDLDLSQLERDWRQDAFSENVGLKAANNLAPWIVVLIATLAIPLVLGLTRRNRAPTA